MIPPHHSIRTCCGSQTRAPGRGAYAASTGDDKPVLNRPYASEPATAKGRERRAPITLGFGNGNNANGVAAEVGLAIGSGWATTVLRLGIICGR